MSRLMFAPAGHSRTCIPTPIRLSPLRTTLSLRPCWCCVGVIDVDSSLRRVLPCTAVGTLTSTQRYIENSLRVVAFAIGSFHTSLGTDRNQPKGPKQPFRVGVDDIRVA